MSKTLHQRIEHLEHVLRDERHAQTRTRARLRRAAALLGMLTLATVPGLAHSYPEAPNAFSPGDPVAADAFNENFDHLVDGITALENAAAPIGAVVAWAGTPGTIPSGWLLCDGAEYDNGTYPDLASAIGSSHGGDGATTFFVPDLRGRFIRGVDEGTGRDPDAADRTQPQTGSGNSGDAVGSVQGSAFGAHVHGTAINFPGNTPGAGAFETGSAGVFGDVMFGASAGSVAAQNSSSVGGAESRPVNAYLHFIIRAE